MQSFFMYVVFSEIPEAETAKITKFPKMRNLKKPEIK